MAYKEEMKFKRRPLWNKWGFWEKEKKRRESMVLAFEAAAQLSCSDRKKVGKNESRKRKYFPDIGYSGRKEPWVETSPCITQ